MCCLAERAAFDYARGQVASSRLRPDSSYVPFQAKLLGVVEDIYYNTRDKSLAALRDFRSYLATVDAVDRPKYMQQFVESLDVDALYSHTSHEDARDALSIRQGHFSPACRKPL
jgi:hypothetical protein